ncbi:PepSY domain-containing protein [Methylobacillus gramineus]|uniref:PepSY-associated TM helix domain-containing protein n=1 Tax=Methylobacillus gramineus TaxID=755169 RepID=UPI001CFF5E39|nr:PepSY-associated TM helix domain-containing protein [Methylobacillus gramineus]MCB5183912.1 PepSY domain-containing protein [Methylobacillus gramineus]
MSTRGVLLAIHRYGGLAIAAFLAIAALTGSIIAFEHELDSWLNPHLFKVLPTGNEPLSPYKLRDIVASRHPQARVNQINLNAQPDHSAIFYLQSWPGDDAVTHNKIFINPYTGLELGKRNTRDPAFTRDNLIPLIYKLHYSLLLPGKWGIWLLGMVAIFWTLDCFIGLYLTLPRKQFSWSSWKQAWLIKRSTGSIRMNYDLHRASGLWLWMLLLVLAVSSVRLNLYEEVFAPVVNIFSPISVRLPAATDTELTLSTEQITFQDAVLIGKRYLEESHIKAQVQSVYYAAELHQFHVSFSAKGIWLDILGYSYVVIDARTGLANSIQWETGNTAGDTFTAWMFPLHSGKAFGLAGRIMIAVSGIAVTMLIITGILIWWKKRRVYQFAIKRQKNTGLHRS